MNDCQYELVTPSNTRPQGIDLIDLSTLEIIQSVFNYSGISAYPEKEWPLTH